MIEINVPLGPIAYVKVSGDTSHQVLAQLTEVLTGEIPGKVGQLVNETDSANVGERMGRLLGAELIEDHDLERLKEDPRNQGVSYGDLAADFNRAAAPTPSAPAAEFTPVPRDPTEIEQTAPGAPLVMDRPAYFASWSDESGSHGAFVHPFLYEMDWAKATSNPEDPRLKTGEAWFFQQIH